MAKRDFLLGLLQGLYQGGVGNPQVNAANRERRLAEAYRQQQLQATMAEKGMVPAGGAQAGAGGRGLPDPNSEEGQGVVKNFLNIMYPMAGFGQDRPQRYVRDPNLPQFSMGAEGEISMNKTGGFPLKPMEGAKLFGAQKQRGIERQRIEERNVLADKRYVAEQTDKLRKELFDETDVKEWLKISGNVTTMNNLFQKRKEGKLKTNVVLDQALITLFNKLTDAASVVRESEYARTPENVAFINRIAGKVEKLGKGGAGITDEDREDIIAGAKIIANGLGGRFNKTRSFYTDLANKRGGIPEEITRGVPAFTPYEFDQMPENIRVSNGRETLTIPVSDEQAALKDGYKRIR